MWPRNRRLAFSWLSALTAGYIVLALPLTAKAISNRLPEFHSAVISKPVDTVVVLDGDNRRGRVLEAAKVDVAAAPNRVWVLGNDWMVEPLIQTGVAPARISHDESATTRDQMAWIKQLLERQNGRTVVIASRLQAPRIAALASTNHLALSVIASPIDTEPPTAGIGLVWPTYVALRVSRDAIYEHAALVYYRWRGWIR